MAAPHDDLAARARDALDVGVGFAVLALQRTGPQRAELCRRLGRAGADLEAQLAPTLDGVAPRLPEPARQVLADVRRRLQDASPKP